MNTLLEFLTALAPAGTIGTLFLWWLLFTAAKERLLWLATGIKRPERYLDD